MRLKSQLCRSFLWRAAAQSGLETSLRRMQCDQKSIIGRMRLDLRCLITSSSENSADTRVTSPLLATHEPLPVHRGLSHAVVHADGKRCATRIRRVSHCGVSGVRLEDLDASLLTPTTVPQATYLRFLSCDAQLIRSNRESADSADSPSLWFGDFLSLKVGSLFEPSV